MRPVKSISTAGASVLAFAIVLTLAACEQMIRGQSGSASQPSVDDMIAKSMDNMKKVMMMAPDEQRRYVMDAQQASLAHGEALFNSAKLGTNGFSCATCHPRGGTTGGRVPMGGMQMAIPTLVGSASTFPKYKVPNDSVITLAEMNNNCVVMFLKGQPLALGSRDARDLALFVASLSKGEALTPGKQSM